MTKSKIFVGILWASCQRFGTMIVSFVCNLVLARLLTPDDFGTVGMLLFFISISNIFIDSGFGSALIQKKNPSKEDYSTIFLINIIISISLYAFLFIIAPLISQFYDNNILTSLLRVEGLVLIGNALCIIQSTILRKVMDFKRLAFANLWGNVIGSLVAIVFAFLGFGVWSLVARVILVSYITSFFLWSLSEWKPIFDFRFKSLKELFGFGGFMLLSTGLNTIASNMQTLLIGKMFQQKILGFYTQAMTLRNVAADSLQNVIAQVLFPNFSSLKSDNEIADKLNRSFYIIAFFTSALLVLLLIIGQPLIILLYTDKWQGSVTYFKILCIGGIFYAIQDINYYVIAAKGKSKVLSYINLIKIPIYILFMFILGKFFGITGVLWTIVGYGLVSYIIYAVIATRIIFTSVWIQIKNLCKSVILSLISGMGVIIISNLFNFSSTLLTMASSSLIYMIILVVLSMIFKVYPMIYILKMIKK